MFAYIGVAKCLAEHAKQCASPEKSPSEGWGGGGGGGARTPTHFFPT